MNLHEYSVKTGMSITSCFHKIGAKNLLVKEIHRNKIKTFTETEDGKKVYKWKSSPISSIRIVPFDPEKHSGRNYGGLIISPDWSKNEGI